MRLAAGTPFGRYVIEDLLGEGGMGCVYAARDQTLGRRVAIKLLRDPMVDDAKMRERFLREARAGAALSHPSATIVHEVGEHDGQAYIAMEYLEGKTLRAYVGADAPDVATRLGWLTDVARVLAVAHVAGLVHRDIKPDNVMVTRDGVVKVLDFGIARVSSGVVDPTAPTRLPGDEGPAGGALTTEGLVVGTPVYMAPEQMLGNPVDGRADQFAWGVMAYELLSGRIPWQSGNGSSGGAQLVALIVSNQPAPPLGGSDIPTGVREVVSRALEKDRERRFSTMTELAAALGVAATGVRIGVDAAVRAPATTRSRALPVWIALGVAVVAAVAAYVVIGKKPAAASSSSSLGASATSSASTTPPAPTVTTLTDQPPPPTKNAEAASEFAAGMQAMRDNNYYQANKAFEHATKLDPTMAAAYLRLAMTLVTFDSDAKQAAFSKALSLRAQLGERDQALMNALAPVLQQTQVNEVEAARRLDAMTEVYPLDVELYDWLGNLREFTPSSLAPSERAIALDPKDGSGWQNKGGALLALGRLAEARDALERCAALNVNSADCVVFEAVADATAGRCEDFEREARAAADRAPEYAMTLASALVAVGAPEQSVEQALEKATTAIGSGNAALGAFFREQQAAQVALVAGDFDRARAHLRDAAATLAAAPSLRATYARSYELAVQSAQIALESGDTAAARAAAGAFVARSPALVRAESQNHGVDLSLYLARVALPDGQAPAAFEDARRAWIDARKASGAYPGSIWDYAYAATALTPSEASAALAALPKYAPLTPFQTWDTIAPGGLPDAEVGRAYLAAGKPDDALPYLRSAVASCNVFAAPVEHTRAMLNLGIVLEKTDKDGACAAYQKVIVRWGHAKPRSVTAEEAKRRATALGCPSSMK
jgi:serine/threonine-protein kinase